MKKTIFALATLVTITLSSCVDNDAPESIDTTTTTSTFVLNENDLKGDIETGTVTLIASKTYKLTGGLVVKSGATLIIPAGTRIEANGTDPNALFIAVERGAKIFINGEANKAVVMTSGKASPAQSDWGGLIICGDAKVNTGDNGTSEVGGLSFGGNNDFDSSGKINFLRIEYTGSKFTADKEYNGISFFGVGSGTQVSNVYAFESGDDGIEFFGGTVNATNLAIVNSYDDSLDFADGYRGTISNVYISGVSKAGIEGSNNKPNEIALPLTDAKISNVSIVKGADAKFTAEEKAINFKEGGGKQNYSNLYIDNSITTAFKINAGVGTTARLAAGDFKITNWFFTGTINQADVFVGTSNTATTGAGNGATLPTWAEQIK